MSNLEKPRVESSSPLLEAIDELKNNPAFLEVLKSGTGRSWLSVEIKRALEKEERTPSQRVHERQVAEAKEELEPVA